MTAKLKGEFEKRFEQYRVIQHDSLSHEVKWTYTVDIEKALDIVEEARKEFLQLVSTSYFDMEGKPVKIKPHILSAKSIKWFKKWFGRTEE